MVLAGMSDDTVVDTVTAAEYSNIPLSFYADFDEVAIGDYRVTASDDNGVIGKGYVRITDEAGEFECRGEYYTDPSVSQDGLVNQGDLPDNFSAMGISVEGYVSRVTLVDSLSSSGIEAVQSGLAVPGSQMALTSTAISTLVAAIWGVATTSLATANSIGKLIVDRMVTILNLDGMIENSSGNRFTQKALEVIEVADPTVVVTPVLSLIRNNFPAPSKIEQAHAETRTHQIHIYQKEGSTSVPVDMSGKEEDLNFVVAKTTREELFRVTSGITVSGESNEIVSVTISSDLIKSREASYYYSLRDPEDGNRLWAHGQFEVIYAP